MRFKCLQCGAEREPLAFHDEDRLKRIVGILDGIPAAMESAGCGLGMSMATGQQLDYWRRQVDLALQLARY